MGTFREPLILTVACAIRHQVVALHFQCICGKQRILPVLLAYRNFGPDISLEAMAKRYRCSCGRRPWKPAPLWRRLQPWWKRHLGPLPPPAFPYRPGAR